MPSISERRGCDTKKHSVKIEITATTPGDNAASLAFVAILHCCERPDVYQVYVRFKSECILLFQRQ